MRLCNFRLYLFSPYLHQESKLLLSPTFVLNVLRDLSIILVSLLTKLQSGHSNDTIFVDQTIRPSQYVVRAHVFDTRSCIAGAQTLFAFPEFSNVDM